MIYNIRCKFCSIFFVLTVSVATLFMLHAFEYTSPRPRTKSSQNNCKKTEITATEIDMLKITIGCDLGDLTR